MKTTKELKIWSLRMVLFTILLSGLSVQKVYSFCNSTEITMHGNWEEVHDKVATRSLPSIPITACTDGQNIYIENTSPDCDIQITITGNQTGEVMYEQLVPQAQTSYIIISIASFPSGEFKVNCFCACTVSVHATTHRNNKIFSFFMVLIIVVIKS